MHLFPKYWRHAGGLKSVNNFEVIIKDEVHYTETIIPQLCYNIEITIIMPVYSPMLSGSDYAQYDTSNA